MEHLHKLEKDDIYSENIKTLPSKHKTLAQKGYGVNFVQIIKDHFRSDYKLFNDLLAHSSRKKEVLIWLESLYCMDELSHTTQNTKKKHAEGIVEKELYHALVAEGHIKKNNEQDKAYIERYGLPIVYAANKFSSMQSFEAVVKSFDSDKYRDLFIYVVNGILHTDKISTTVKTTTNGLINALQKNVDSKMKSISVEVGSDVFDKILEDNNKGKYYIVAPNHMIADNFYTKNFLLPYDFYALQQLFEKNGSGCGPVALVNRPAQASLEKLGFSSESTEETLKYFV